MPRPSIFGKFAFGEFNNGVCRKSKQRVGKQNNIMNSKMDELLEDILRIAEKIRENKPFTTYDEKKRDVKSNIEEFQVGDKVQCMFDKPELIYEIKKIRKDGSLQFIDIQLLNDTINYRVQDFALTKRQDDNNK